MYVLTGISCLSCSIWTELVTFFILTDFCRKEKVHRQIFRLLFLACLKPSVGQAELARKPAGKSNTIKALSGKPKADTSGLDIIQTTGEHSFNVTGSSEETMTQGTAWIAKTTLTAVFEGSRDDRSSNIKY